MPVKEKSLSTRSHNQPKKVAVCNTCTLQLVRLAYQQAPWFSLVREPLRLGMQAMAAWHRIDPNSYQVRTASCYGCLRFLKTELKEKSAAFRWLNACVNPLFDALLEAKVSSAAVQEAKAYARRAMAGEAQWKGETGNPNGATPLIDARSLEKVQGEAAWDKLNAEG